MGTVKKIAILIMAAGGSKRLGRAKQLLPFKGGILLDRTIEESIASNIGEVYVVLGAYQTEISSRIQSDHQVNLLINKNWEEGLSNSIAYGISQLESKDIKGVIILLGDQIYLDKKVLLKLSKFISSSSARIIISEYKEGSGPPSFFDSSLFPELMQLQGDEGAKEIVKKYKAEVKKIYFEKGYLDIDEECDVKLLEELE